nr:MAG TPA: minor capsid protein [Caudoviricetes sp.]
MLLVIMAVAMMTTTDRLGQLINKLNKSWRKDAKKAVAYLQRLLASGMKFEEALDNVQRHYGKLFTLPELRPALVEAAAYAYGIVPTMLTKAQVESMGEELADKWDESGMTLSEKLHGVGVKMRGAIVSTLQEQMRRNKTWTEAARALYDGYGDDGQNVYNGGKDIISRQDLPKYLQKVREATGNDLQALAEQRQAIDNINRLAKNGAPNKALQAAYNKLLEAVQKGNEKAIEKAVEVAVNEKSRYVAERITRTEMARAWADGFIAKMQKDADIVAVKFKLSSRHPVFDICDMYAKADMYGLGAGIYPKDKLPPLPVHPHCLCRYVEVIEGEVDMQQQRDQVREAGDKWLNSLLESRRAQVLGRKGLKAWEDGEDWRKYMRGYAGLREMKSRLKESVLEPQKRGVKTIITQKTIDNIGQFQYPGFTKRENELMLQAQKELLAIARDKNNSNEVAMVLTSDLKGKTILLGNDNLLDFGTAKAKNILAGGESLYIIHNHPRGYGFSLDDIHILTDNNSVKSISLITNSGRIETLQKTANYDKIMINKIQTKVLKRCRKNNLDYETYIKLLLKEFTEGGMVLWKL